MGECGDEDDHHNTRGIGELSGRAGSRQGQTSARIHTRHTEISVLWQREGVEIGDVIVRGEGQGNGCVARYTLYDGGSGDTGIDKNGDGNVDIAECSCL